MARKTSKDNKISINQYKLCLFFISLAFNFILNWINNLEETRIPMKILSLSDFFLPHKKINQFKLFFPNECQVDEKQNWMGKTALFNPLWRFFSDCEVNFPIRNQISSRAFYQSA